MLREMLGELIIYILSYSIFAFFMVLLSKRIKNKKIASLIVILSCIIYASIRYNVGSDYDTYYLQYNNILNYFSSPTQILNADFQAGFNLLEFFTKVYLQNQYAIFFVVSLIVYPLNFYIIRKCSKNFGESVLLYFLLGFHLVSLNILKQEIAMVIFLVIYKLLSSPRKKWWSYTLIIGLSVVMVSFHISAIIPLIILLAARFINPTRLKIILSLAASFILLFAYTTIMSASTFFERYVGYLDTVNHEYYIVIIGAIGYLIFTSIILLFLIRKKKELVKINPINKYIISALILSIPFKVIGVDNFPIYRLSLYIDQLFLFIIPDLLTIYKKQNPARYRSAYISYLALMYIFFVFSIVFLAHNNFYTYQTIFGRG